MDKVLDLRLDVLDRLTHRFAQLVVVRPFVRRIETPFESVKRNHILVRPIIHFFRIFEILADVRASVHQLEKKLGTFSYEGHGDARDEEPLYAVLYFMEYGVRPDSSRSVTAHRLVCALLCRRANA